MGYGLGYDSKKPIKGHVHHYETRTSYDAGHTHVVAGTTSPTINPGPRHVHIMEGTTTTNAGHSHRYKATTGPAIPTKPGYHVHRYSGNVSVAGQIPHTHRYQGVTSEAPNDY
ncbi:YmaF family protein [Desulfurispora thermophila]|uniref:YmaF family protein n=1 Tax=Desulfurispora thermophila TaxID=265470 RepID=UPI000A0718CA